MSNKIILENNTINVILKNYEASFSGLIQSWIERFPTADVSELLIQLWEKDKNYFASENIN